MGNATTPIANLSNSVSISPGAGTFTDHLTQTFTEDVWVDSLWFSIGSPAGAANYHFGLYNADTDSLVLTSNNLAMSNVAAVYVRATTALTAFASGYNFRIGAHCDRQSQATSWRNNNWFYFNSSGSIAAQSINGSPNPFGFSGGTFWFAEYYKRCQIYTTPAGLWQAGQSFQITGRSFNAGVTAVTINGVSCSTYSVDSDSQMTIQVPSGATTGYVQVTSNAGGVITSPNTVQVGPGFWFKSGGTLQRGKGAWYKSGGTLHPVTGIWVKQGGTLHQTQ